MKHLVAVGVLWAMCLAPAWPQSIGSIIKGFSQKDYEKSFPAAVRTDKVYGFVRANCTLAESGQLRDCAYLEHPSGYGLSAAAARLAPKIYAQPGHPDTRAVVLWFEFDGRLKEGNNAWVWFEYPSKQLTLGASGEVRLSCLLKRSGPLQDCRIIGATQGSEPFATQAIKSAQKMKYDLLASQPTRVNKWFIYAYDGYMVTPRYSLNDPMWQRTPSTEEVAAAAAMHGVVTPGYVGFQCVVRPDGFLDGCSDGYPARDPLRTAGKSLLGQYQVGPLERLPVVEGATVDVVVEFGAPIAE